MVTGVGSIVIDANQAGNADYTAAPQVQRTLVVSLAAQAINFTQPSAVTYSPGLTIALVATGGASGNPVVFTIDASSTGKGTISGSTLTVTAVGSIVIDANQAGNANYTAAPQVQRTVAVNQAAQTINFTQPASPVTYAPGLTFPLTATGGASGNAVVFTIDPSSTAAATISGSTVTITGVGNIVIDANQAGNADYTAAAQVQRTVAVSQGVQAISFAQPASPVAYGPGLTFPLTATGGASGNPVVLTIDSSSTAAATISGNTITVKGVGSIVIDANQAGNSLYSAAPQVQRTVVVNPAAQAITFAQPVTPVTYAPGLKFALTASGGASGNVVVFTIDSSSTATATISGSTLTVTGVGNIVIDANQAGSSLYSAAPQVQRTVVVNPAAQSITFAQPASPVIYAPGLTFALTASGGASGNPVVFTIDAGSTATATIAGSTVTVTGVGSIVIDANQAGSSLYSAAPQVQRTVTVNPASQAITFAQPSSPVVYSSGLAIALTATGGASGNPVVFTVDASSTGTGTISGSNLTVMTAGTIVLDANEAGNSDYSAAPQVQRTVVVNPATQAISFTPPTSPFAYASGLTISLAATGGPSGNPVVFTIDASSTGTGTISGATLTVTKVGSIVVDANQAGNADYSAAPQVQRTFVVTPAQQVIIFTQPTSPVTYNAGLTIPLVATGGPSGNPVVFTIDASSTATGSISGSTLTVTSIGTLVIDANQAGNADYTASAQVQRTIVVNAPIPQAINFTQPTSPVTYSPGLTIALTATGGASGNPVIFSIDAGSTATGTISGSTLTVTGVGSIVIDANQAGNTNYAAAPQVQKTVVVTLAPQVINFAQPTSPITYSSGLTITLTATGGASGNAVVFTIDAASTATGTVSGNVVTLTTAGNLVIDANQAGNADYSAAPEVQRTVVVNEDFSISATPPSQTVAKGASTTFTITAASVGGAFNNPIDLTVTGLPPGATAVFAPTSITPGNGSATSTLTVQAANSPLAQSSPNIWPLATPALALLILVPFRRWRKVWSGRLMLLLAGLASLGAAAALTGCGGGFTLNVSQNYTLTITGTSGSETHSTTVQLTVQ